MKRIILLVIVLIFHAAAFAQWVVTDSMSMARAGHVCANLPNGNVLITGGWDYTSNLSSTEIYDAINNTWSDAASMSEARYLATATTLNNGNILVVGGYDGTSNLASCELYNPSNNTWSQAGDLTLGRSSHTATKLQNGKVLVVGGYTGTLNTPVCELYDPANNTWSSAGTLVYGRSYHTATLLDNGNVAVIGGYDPTTTFQLTSVEIYNSSLNTWSAGASMTEARDFHSASKLQNGKILVSGGRVFTGATPNYNGLASAELYDPIANTWVDASQFTDTPVCYGQQVTLNNGNVLNIAGLASFDTPTSASTPSVTYLYYTALDAWDTTTMAYDSRFEFASLLMNDGRVMVSGGANNSVELFGLASQTSFHFINQPKHIVDVYPNPVDDYLVIKATQVFNDLTVSIVNSQGTVIALEIKQNAAGVSYLETNALSNGIYFLKVDTGAAIEIKKISVAH